MKSNHPIASFFLVVSPPFAPMAKRELERFCALNQKGQQLKNISVNQSGVSFQTSMELGFSLNYYLKIPTRILLRLKKGRCFNQKMFIHLLEQIPWKQYLSDIPEFIISCKKSQLYHTNMLQEWASEFFQRLGLQPVQSTSFKVYIQFRHDTCQISLDTSGLPLYKRGFRQLSHKASIRENLVASLYEWALPHIDTQKYYTFVDPFCGMGTTAIEHLTLSMPHFHRSFTFEQFPMLKGLKLEKELQLPQWFFANSYTLKDIESSYIQKLKELPLLSSYSFEFEQIDIRKDQPTEKENVFVVSNIPYGKRVDKKLNLKNIIEICTMIYNPISMLFILPSDWQTPPLKNSHCLNFYNGGLRVKALLILKP